MEKLKKWGDYLSGYASGVVSCTICAPLDLTRTRMNLSRTTAAPLTGFLDTFIGIYKQKGYIGYYDGFSATLLGVPTFQFLYFGIYYRLKANSNFGENRKFLRDMYCAMVSGSICQVLTNPIWVIRIRMQSAIMHSDKPKRSIIQTTKRIYSKEGLTGFYKGTTASLLALGVFHVCINMPCYDYFIRYFTENDKKDPTKWEIMVASNAAKTIACVITYPHVVLRSRQQDFRNLAHQGNYYKVADKECRKVVLPLRQVIKQTFKREGFVGFYGGIVPDLIKVLPTNTILMLSFEYFRHLFGINEH